VIDLVREGGAGADLFALVELALVALGLETLVDVELVKVGLLALVELVDGLGGGMAGEARPRPD